MSRLVLLVTLCLCGGVASAQEEPAFGAFITQIDGISDPRGLAVTAGGTIIVSETARDRLLLFGPDGTPRGTWAPVEPGDGPGLSRPHGLAVTADGDVLVCDTGNHRIVRLGPDGTWREAFGGYGLEPGRLRGPRDVAVAGDRVYVADTDNARLQVFDAGGDATVIGSWGDEDGRFIELVGVEVAEDGSIFTVDAGRNRVQKMDPDGGVIVAWGGWGTFPGLFSEPSGITLFMEYVVVTDRLGHRVQVFDRDGAFVDQWGKHALLPREGEGRIHYPNAVAAAPDGAFVVIAEAFENRLQLFGPTGTDVDKGPPSMKPRMEVQSHFASTVDCDGQLLTVSEPETSAILLFDLRNEVPIHITTYGEAGQRWGQFMLIGTLAVDEQTRRVTVTDIGNARVQTLGFDFTRDETLRFDPKKLRFTRGWPIKGPPAAPPAAVIAIDHDADGRVFRLDRRTASVEVLDDGITVTGRFGGPGTGAAELRMPTDLAVSGDAVYVVDSGNHRVQVFGTDGTHRFSFGRQGAAAGEFIDAFGVAADDEGAIYVTDSALDRVEKFDGDGNFLKEWGSTGRDHGQFWKPRGIAADQRESLRLIVVDRGNHRMQAFEPDGAWLVTFGVGRAWTRQNVPSMRPN